MIPSIVPARDINGPKSRMYYSRDTIYVSASGKDGYMGYTSKTPIQTLKKTSELLKLINVIPTTVDIEYGIYSDVLTMTRSSSGRPITIKGNSSIITKNLQSFVPTLHTNKYIKYDIPTDKNDNFQIDRGSFYLDDCHLKPISFPRRGAYFGSYTKITSNSYWIRDKSGFLERISPIINTYLNNNSPTLALGVHGTPFYSSTPSTSQITSITLSSDNKFVFQFNYSGSDSFCIIPFEPNSKLNYSSIVEYIDFEDGDYLLSKEEPGVMSLYCKPFKDGENVLKIHPDERYTLPVDEMASVNIRDIDNINIFDLHVMYGYQNIAIANTNNISITGCKFKNSKSSNMSLLSSTKTNILNNMITSSGGNAIYALVLSAMVIDNNFIYGSGLNNTGEGYGNAVYTSINGSYAHRLTDLKITNNNIKYSSGGALDINFVKNISISGNRVENTGFGFSEDMAAIRTGASGPGSISNNLIKNSRSHTASRNGMGMYIDGQCTQINCHSNIIDNATTPFLSNEPSRHDVYNNIFMNGRGPNHPWQIQFTTSNDNLNTIGYNPTYYGLSAFSNIHIAAMSNVARYMKDYDKYFYRPSINFFSADSIHPALRLTHKFFSSNLDDHKIFYTTPSYGSSNNFSYMRIGVYNDRPVYSTGNNQRLMVRDGNWIQILWNYYNTPVPTLSTSCGIEGYNYPWQVPSNAWFESSTKIPVANLSFVFHGGQWKRSVPLYTQNNNCFYTDLSCSTDSLTLSTDSYAFRGRIQRDIYGNHINSNYENVSYDETITSANMEVIPLSSSFEEVLPSWNTNSIFSDPMLDRDTYIVQNTSVLEHLNFKNIDIGIIGIDDNNPFVEDIGEEKFSPTWGSLDWSESSYGNHNDLPYLQTVVTSIPNLRNYTYYFDSPITVENVGNYRWDKSSNALDDGNATIKPNSTIYNTYGRWLKI